MSDDRKTTERVGRNRIAGALAKLDGRTKEAALIRQTRSALIAHCGGTPSATERVLIERAVMLTVRLARMDAKALESDAVALSHDAQRDYLGFSNALNRTMRQLGLKGAAQREQTLEAYLASKTAA